MEENRLSLLDLKKHLEQKAYSYGISNAISTLLGEYLLELLTKPYYVRSTSHKVVQQPS